jgi:hypothetical protein
MVAVGAVVSVTPPALTLKAILKLVVLALEAPSEHLA